MSGPKKHEYRVTEARILTSQASEDIWGAQSSKASELCAFFGRSSAVAENNGTRSLLGGEIMADVLIHC
jgi:hypothetical protein